MDKAVHFEIPFDDAKRAGDFYKKVFGWKLNEMPEMNYTIVHTVDVDEKMMPKEVGAINGGMFKRDDKSASGPVIVMGVKSIEETIKKITNNGGKVFKRKSSVGDMGFYAQVKDTEGNIIGIWETIKK